MIFDTKVILKAVKKIGLKEVFFCIENNSICLSGYFMPPNQRREFFERIIVTDEGIFFKIAVYGWKSNKEPYVVKVIKDKVSAVQIENFFVESLECTEESIGSCTYFHLN